MTADKYIRLIFLYQFTCTKVITTGVTSYMNEQDFLSINGKTQMLTGCVADLETVTVAPDGAQRFKSFELRNNINISGITRMPDFVDIGKVLIYSRI